MLKPPPYLFDDHVFAVGLRQVWPLDRDVGTRFWQLRQIKLERIVRLKLADFTYDDKSNTSKPNSKGWRLAGRRPWIGLFNNEQACPTVAGIAGELYCLG
jgi:hypothetical protein